MTQMPPEPREIHPYDADLTRSDAIADYRPRPLISEPSFSPEAESLPKAGAAVAEEQSPQPELPLGGSTESESALESARSTHPSQYHPPVAPETPPVPTMPPALSVVRDLPPPNETS